MKPANIDVSLQAIGLRIKTTREACGLRPVDVCRAIGIKANTYSQWESGERRPNLDDMIRFCCQYDVTLDWIYLGDMSGLKFSVGSKIQMQK